MIKKEFFRSLKREKKEATLLLSIGSFLEYFDLMIYIHMAVLLNEVFFPKTDDLHTKYLFTAIAFSSSYVLRPLGLLLFGWLGDNIGRKTTVIITTIIISVSCIIMANLPTYAQIGISATWIITICRLMQGMASMVGIIGAELYLTEITKPPVQYPIVAMIAVFAVLGINFPLLVVSFATSVATSLDASLRIVFWVGSIVALIGSVARTKLRETTEFADAKQRIKSIFLEANHDIKKLDSNLIYNEKASPSTLFALFFVQCGWPACFFVAYIHFGYILMQDYSLDPIMVTQNNLLISVVNILSCATLVFLSYKIHPLKILKLTTIIFIGFLAISPYLLGTASSTLDITLIQGFLAIFVLNHAPAAPIFFKNLPVFKRFSYTSLTYALARSITSIVTSFGLVYLTKYFNNWSILLLMLPIATGYWYGLSHFEKLEKERLKNTLF